MSTSFNVYLYSAPFYVGQNNKLISVLLDETGLTDLSISEDVTYEVINYPYPLALYVDTDGYTNFIPMQIGDYRIKASYDGLYSYISFNVIYNPIFLNVDQCYQIYRQELIPGVYSSSQDPSKSLTYCDDYATAEQLATAYDMVRQLYEEGYPESGANIQAWEFLLTGSTEIYDPSSDYTPKLLQFLRNIQATGSLNAYVLALFVSEYISYRTGHAYFVYVKEHIARPTNSWILGTSRLNINTYLNPSDPRYYQKIEFFIFQESNPAISAQVQSEITWLINKILRGDLNFTVNYTSAPSDFNLTETRTTYFGDAGLNQTYCIKFPLDSISLISLQPPLKAAYALIKPV